MATEKQVPPSPDNAEGPNLTYTINNELIVPYFRATINLPITPGKRLIHYMELACRMNPNQFSRFSVTYFPAVPGGAGYFVDSINSVSGLSEPDPRYWTMSNQDGILNVGVSLYEPRPMDQILCNLAPRRN